MLFIKQSRSVLQGNNDVHLRLRLLQYLDNTVDKQQFIV